MLTPSQLKKIEKIIRTRFRAFSYRTLGRHAITEEELEDLKSLGLLPASTREYISDAVALGKISAALGPVTVRTLSYDQILEMLKRMHPTTNVERKAAQYATDHAGQYIRGLEDDMVRDVRLASTKTSVQVLREEVSNAINDRTTPSQLKSNLFNLIDHRGRDWQRIASTELQNAIQHGIYHEIRESAEQGDMALCYKRPAPNACKHCKRLYLSDGKPKIFRLKDLIVSNAGQKAANWKPCIEATHPWCGCQLFMLPKGHEFGMRRVASEEFEHKGKTVRRGQLVDDIYDDLSSEAKRKTTVDAILEYTGEDAEPVSKAELNLPFSDEDCDHVYEL